MPNETRSRFLQRLTEQFGALRALPNSHSLFEIGNGDARVYLRYSKRHPGNRTFFGLRASDLRVLQGHNSFVGFLWDDQAEPLVIPLSEYEEVFQNIEPANDGQFKAQVYLDDNGTQLYLAQAGRFNVESHLGWENLDRLVRLRDEPVPDLTHPQVQTLLGAIGARKGYDVWIPASDRSRLDWQVAQPFSCRTILPPAFDAVRPILQEVDVIWLQRGGSDLTGLFEVEHSTSIYSGLIRFNDVHLVSPRLGAKYTIVANESRRALFLRQLNRPTFVTSGLSGLCSFLDYRDVYAWQRRLAS